MWIETPRGFFWFSRSWLGWAWTNGRKRINLARDGFSRRRRLRTDRLAKNGSRQVNAQKIKCGSESRADKTSAQDTLRSESWDIVSSLWLHEKRAKVIITNFASTDISEKTPLLKIQSQISDRFATMNILGSRFPPLNLGWFFLNEVS